MLLDLLAIYMCCLWNKVWSKCTKNILLVPRIHERKTCMSVFFLIDIYTRKKKNERRKKSTQVLPTPFECRWAWRGANISEFYYILSPLHYFIVSVSATEKDIFSCRLYNVNIDMCLTEKFGETKVLQDYALMEAEWNH